MIIKQSVHFSDACAQSGNFLSLDRLIERGKRKWHITSTLVYIYPKGLHAVYYLDVDGKCVTYRLTRVPGDYPTVGEVTYTEETIEVK